MCVCGLWAQLRTDYFGLEIYEERFDWEKSWVKINERERYRIYFAIESFSQQTLYTLKNVRCSLPTTVCGAQLGVKFENSFFKIS